MSPSAGSAARIINDPRWTALVTRDPAADGQFVYSVSSTGIYCRATCAARRPRPEHVAFHATPGEAERCGFRPCRRCCPEQPPFAVRQAGKIAELCRFIDTADHLPTLAELAERCALSAGHLQRIFKAVTGLSPKAYCATQRGLRVRDELTRSASVTDAIFAAGYNSNGRFYEESNQLLGMTPSTYRAGGVNTEIRFATGECSLGAILVAQSERGICAILLGDEPQALVDDLCLRFGAATLIAGDPSFTQLVARVVAFVEKPQLGLDLPLDLRGTVFQQRVWQVLRAIPAGQTTNYSEIAQRIGMPRAVRAVASAIAANPLAIAVPCHRVLRSDGTLSGYRWGVSRKKKLLEREAGK